MVKGIALVLLIVLQFLLTLATYWYVFHLWPVSWMAFCLCNFASIVLTVCGLIIQRER